jgi:hypothetical protein
MLLVRRFLVIAALAFWQGGFVFYASVVVPVGTDTFGRHYPAPHGEPVSGKRQQGRITRTVALWINVSGAVALVPLGWDLLAGTEVGPRRRWRVSLLVGIAALLAALTGLYLQMDAQFQRDTLQIADETTFIMRHRAYLWVIAAQWAVCLVYLALTLGAWRSEDMESARTSTKTPAGRGYYEAVFPKGHQK